MKSNLKTHVIYCLAALAISTFSFYQTAFAQADRALNFLPIVPHGRNINPAIIPNYKLYIGIPLLSGVKTGFENSINYEDIFLKKGDSLLLDRDHILGNIDDETNINFNLMEEYLTFGFMAGKNYFHFRVADIAQTNIVIQKEFLRFLMYGNGSSEYLGKTVELGGEKIDLSYYREYSLGYARQINEKLSVGVNLKYLQGIANISTNSLGFQLSTNPDDFTMSIKSDIQINISSPGIGVKSAEAADFLPNASNKGFAIDLGGQYIVNEKITTWASLIDLGSINWNANIKNYNTEQPDKTFTYDGFDIGEFFQNNEIDNGKINNILDSIANEFGIIETEENYKNSLSPALNIGGAYNLTKNDMFSLIVGNKFNGDNNWTTASLAYTRKFSRDVNLMVSNTFFKDSFLNPGIGFAANIGPVQLYLINENFIAPFVLNKSNAFSVRFGVNLVFEQKGRNLNSENSVDGEKNN